MTSAQLDARSSSFSAMPAMPRLAMPDRAMPDLTKPATPDLAPPCLTPTDRTQPSLACHEAPHPDSEPSATAIAKGTTVSGRGRWRETAAVAWWCPGAQEYRYDKVVKVGDVASVA